MNTLLYRNEWILKILKSQFVYDLPVKITNLLIKRSLKIYYLLLTTGLKTRYLLLHGTVDLSETLCKELLKRLSNMVKLVLF